MTKPQSLLDAAIAIVRDLEEFKRSGSKEAFRKQLREEFLRRSGAASLDEALATAMASLLSQTLGRAGYRGNELPDRPSRENAPAKYELDSNSHQSPRRRPEYQRVPSSESAGTETSLTDLERPAEREAIGRLGRLLQPTTNMPLRSQLLKNRPAVRVFFFCAPPTARKHRW
jgi:hypothetical protein